MKINWETVLPIIAIILSMALAVIGLDLYRKWQEPADNSPLERYPRQYKWEMIKDTVPSMTETRFKSEEFDTLLPMCGTYIIKDTKTETEFLVIIHIYGGVALTKIK